MKNLIDITREYLDLVDIDTYAVQLHLFSKQKKRIFRKYLENHGIEIISLGGEMGRADLASRSKVELLIKNLQTRMGLDALLNQSREGVEE